MIRPAKKDDKRFASCLIYDAIDDIALSLTGETEKNKVLSQLGQFFCEDQNRLSYRNTLVKTVDGLPIGIAITYHGKDAYSLDEPIRQHLLKTNGVKPNIDQEADESDFYLDTLSVNPQFGGRGYGTELLNASIQSGKELGYHTLSLNVEKSNTKARKLYERIGFTYKKTITIHQHLYDYMVVSLT
ncbi:GNAT family N-acetyltransferase [Mesobacillus maritimus]|uniref:GNAT family N-acetyltransferase n=1 Tax=Mesobacillus maritimus TaxID=1643336 RepID=UPI0020420DDF|nr:GNAT family N-acetyltransferase [Mesobacillus maritimus]MCM3671136.1 GNAT family N-acetyltransferase [Mesobacillus maritimus]